MNPRAIDRAARQRDEIRRAWLELVRMRPFERPTAKEIGHCLRFRLSVRAIQWHMAAIRAEALRAELAALQDGVASAAIHHPEVPA